MVHQLDVGSQGELYRVAFEGGRRLRRRSSLAGFGGWAHLGCGTYRVGIRYCEVDGTDCGHSNTFLDFRKVIGVNLAGINQAAS